MNAKELMNIDRIEFPETTTEPLLDIGYRRHRLYRNDGLDFQIGISCTGIEAKRNINLDGLIEIRDWLDEIIKAANKKESP